LRRRALRPLGPLSQLGVEQIEITVADCDDVLTHDGLGIDRPHTVDPDRCNVHEVAGRLIAAPEHVPGDNHQTRGRGRYVGDEFTASAHTWLLTQSPTPCLRTPLSPCAPSPSRPP